jgi:hypothetical protein
MDVDNLYMEVRKQKTKDFQMIQWVGILFTLVGLVYTGVKDYQKGDIKLPEIKKPLTVVKYPVQYCLMAYDPNLDKVFYLHENGQWYDYAPQQRRYEATPQVRQQTQTQGQTALGTVNGPQGISRYGYGQQAQATAYTQRY